MINIKGLKKSQVLAVLYNNSKPLGLGIFDFNSKNMTEQEAEELLKHQTYFDYLKGRVMKVDLKDNDRFNEYLYDRDNGRGAAQRAINKIC